ncbi:glycosyltransferase family 2 protein [Thermococcus sp. AM4]|uniref:glycosyltransferase n=1 Tax=Thermococcus sp. (strain AM4) TaxID=246969 RepID=UPI0006500341|nr:glycosyltransferase [Thermococcus sp. AM4]
MSMRSMKNRNYILVTPAKNEEKTLPLLAKSIVNQSIRPKLWVIVDDNSTDKTPEIVDRLASEYEWIVGHHLEDNEVEYNPVFRNAVTYREGLKKALEMSKRLAIPFGYIGIVDADFILERRFFEKLILRFLKEPSLGIVSGGVYYKKNGRLVWEKSNPNFPRGSPRLIRFECFFDIGGYPLEPAPDLVAYYLARIKGWRTFQVVNAIGVELRPTGTRGNVIERYKKQGFVSYYIGIPPLSECFYSIYLILFDDVQKGIGHFIGYFRALFRREYQISTPLIRHFVEEDFSIKTMFKKFWLLNL